MNLPNMKKKPAEPFGKKHAPQMPFVYEGSEIEAVEAHISACFGAFENVFHEIVSPDIHVDIALIPPTAERPYNVLVTMGMGAYRMNVPEQFAEQAAERAEVMICLPPDWKFDSGEEPWYWPLRWLKIMARLPLEQDTWLGFGHTVPNGGPFAGNTKLSGMALSLPVQFGKESHLCRLPDGNRIAFYQLIPLYDEEMDYKLQNGAEALFEKMTDGVMAVVNINRPNTVI